MQTSHSNTYTYVGRIKENKTVRHLDASTQSWEQSLWLTSQSQGATAFSSNKLYIDIFAYGNYFCQKMYKFHFENKQQKTSHALRSFINHASSYALQIPQQPSQLLTAQSAFSLWPSRGVFPLTLSLVCLLLSDATCRLSCSLSAACCLLSSLRFFFSAWILL